VLAAAKNGMLRAIAEAIQGELASVEGHGGRSGKRVQKKEPSQTNSPVSLALKKRTMATAVGEI